MGALAPTAPWIPEDDVLLKNAVEHGVHRTNQWSSLWHKERRYWIAGASLESLAKGAVQFSRRYTVRELQERWYSLLYDPVISAEASAHMIEFEHSAPTMAWKFTKLGNSKENKFFSAKRKAQSVRNCYYAIRKRLGNEPFNSEDYNYLMVSSNGSCLRTVDHTLTGDYILRDPNLSHLELQESDLEIRHGTVPNILTDGVISTTNALEKDVNNPTEGFPVEQDDLSREMPDPLVREAGHRELFDTDNLEAKPFSAFAPVNQNGENVCLELEQNHAFNSSILDCGASFHGLDCSSPLPDMPIWKAVEGISTPDDISLREKHLSIEEAFAIEDIETKNADQPVVSTEGYLAELSKSLLNFTNEEELLFMDVDAKDVFDKSYYDGLSSLLLNSPVDTNQEGDTADFAEAIAAAVASNADVVPDEEVCKPEECIVSTVSGSTTQFSETCDGFMFCTLNMEDSDIPCNDDVVFSKTCAPSSAFTKAKNRFQESSNCIPSPSLGELSANQRTIERRPSISHGHYHGLSQPIGSQVSAKNSSNPTVGSAEGIKCEVSSGNIDANLTDRADSSSIRLENLPISTLKEEPLEISRIKHLTSNSTDSALDRLLNDSDKFQSQQLDGPQEVRDPLGSELGPMDTACLESGRGLSSSAPEQIGSDDDLPTFSDIEAMILDMDLDPDDQDFYSNEEVLRYNNVVARRTIVRLEQGALSFMQRAIASHGAFAILYGRYSKHYIRKQEVLLGRGTEYFQVDIDLGKEEQFNRISRRQATVKLENNGSFLLKNLGDKYPIWVNNKSVAPGLSVTLTPNCLIEIRGMPFIFDVNPRCVKRFLEHTPVKQQEQR